MRKTLSLLSTILTAFLAVLFSDTAFSQDTSVPDDFEVTLYSAPVMPGAQPGPMGVIISRDGTAVLTRENDQGEETSRTVALHEGVPGALWGIIEKEGFFSLEPLYEDPDVVDGDYAIITVTANDETHEVRTVNTRVDAFDTIALWVNSYFPVEEMVLYNALLDSGEGEAGQ